MTDLFRKQAVEQQTQRLHGEVLLLPRTSHSVIVLALFTWLLAVIFWLATSSFTRKETINGWLEPAEGVVRVYARSAGIVKQILVSDGDWVDVDQPLAIVNGDRTLTSGFHLETVLLNEYSSQKALLNEQLDRIQFVGQRQLSDVNAQISSAKKELALLQLQQKTAEKRHQLLIGQVNKYRDLHQKGHVSQVDVDAVMNSELELRSEKQRLDRAIVSQTARLAELNTQADLLPEESANQAAQLRQRLSDLAQQVAQLQGQRAYVIKSPRAGYINNLQIRVGHQAMTQQPLLTVVPKDAQLTAHLLAPVSAAGFIEAGQPIRIRYDAFPYQKFGLYSGVIEKVSTSVSLPNELRDVPTPVSGPTYRLIAKLDQTSVSAYGQSLELKPGMTFSADVRLSERSLLEWLLEPILSLKGRFA